MLVTVIEQSTRRGWYWYVLDPTGEVLAAKAACRAGFEIAAVVQEALTTAALRGDLTPYELTDAEAAAEAAAEQEAFEAQDAALDAELARLPAVTWTEEDAAEAERRELARQERG